MKSDRAQNTKSRATNKWTAGRAAARRAIALVSMLAITVPVLITSLAEPAGAATFSVPGLVSNSAIGHDTGLTVGTSITLTATGGWTENTASCATCRGPNGIPPLAENQANWLVPNANAFVLAGRIGTSGPWTVVGSGPVTLTGSGTLYMAMNDRLPSYADNGGSMSVHVSDSLDLSTQYNASGPVLAGAPLEWQGTIVNSNEQSFNGGTAFISLGADAVDPPTWEVPFYEASGECDPSEGGVYVCDFGAIPAGGAAFIEASVSTQGVRPGVIEDSMVVYTSQSNSFSAVAAVAQQQIDGLRFDVVAPDTIPEGAVLSLTTTVTNTSATETISGIVVHGNISDGTFHWGPPDCAVDNGGEGGPTIDCPIDGSFTLPPGASLDGTTTVNTDGLFDSTIDWQVYADSPDLGGFSYTEEGSVDVVANTGAAAPSVSIVSPANNAKLGRTLSYTFRANATPAAGQTIDYVDLQVDDDPRTIDTVPPYTHTIDAGDLTPGQHFLTATAHGSDGQSTSTFITVRAAAPPNVTIVPPAGFTNLDSAKTFKSTATPGSGAPGVTIARVEYSVDGGPSIGSATAAPYSFVVDPAAANLYLTAGTHTLTATAFDSLGQSSTDDFDFTVPEATLAIAGTTPPIEDSITANGDAAWPIQVNNTSGVVARHVSLTLEVRATDPNDDSVALSFDLGAINGGLNRPPTTQSCIHDDGPTFTCALPDIPAHSSLSSPFRIFVTTGGVVTGSTIAGDATAFAANADPVTGDLGTVDVIDCGTTCVIGVAAPGDPFASTPNAPTPTNPTKQVITLSSGTAGGPPLPALTVELKSINPTSATDPNDAKLCPTAPGQTHCNGQISSVIAHFGEYVNKKNPIRVTIIARWGTTIPPNMHTLMEKDSGGDPIFLRPCAVDSVTREFNTPCVLPDIVHGTSGAGNLTTYTSILFVGDDVHFARRVVDANGTVINPPAAPTNVVATPGVANAKLTWRAPTVTNGAGVTGYAVTVLSGGVVQKKVLFDNANTTQTITGLTGGKTYVFKVAAENVAGPGPLSAGSNAAKAIGKPPAPTGLTAVAGVGQATLRWTAPTTNNGGAITGYVVTVLVGGVATKTVTFTGTAVTQTVTGLTRGTSYTFKVAAKNIAGVGPTSAASNTVKPT